MANRRTTFGKLERDKAKRAKQAAKRERRLEKGSEPDDDDGVDDRPATSMSQDQVLERIQALHERFEAGTIDFETFEEEKDSLMSLLTVE